MLGYFFYLFFLEKKSEFVAWKKGFSKGMLRNPSITFLTWILRTWPPRDRSPPTTPTNPMYGSLLRNCSFVNIKSYSTVWNFVLSSPLRFRHLYQCMNLKEYVVQHLTDSSLELEFRTPLFFSFGPSRDYGMDLCLEVYLWAIYPYFTTFRVTTLSFY